MNNETIAALREARAIFQAWRDQANDELKYLTDQRSRVLAARESRTYTNRVNAIDSILR